MGRTNEAVKTWRKKTKTRIIEAMGGSCVCCGYDRCQSALALHHLDPNKKDFSFGSVRAVARSWERMVNELRKYILVCHNCHAEVHEGKRKIPSNVAKFNEKFSDYKELEKRNREASWLSCPGCDKKVPPHKKHCSTDCAWKTYDRVNWDSIDLNEMWNRLNSKRKIAMILGVSDKTVAKRLSKAGIC